MKILLCEDDQSIRRIVDVTLSPRGHVVDCAENAKEAIDLFDAAWNSDAPYELILADIHLPGPSGYSLAGYVRGRGYEGRLAALTAMGAEPDNLAQVGAEYWPKPEALGDLIERVETGKAQ